MNTAVCKRSNNSNIYRSYRRSASGKKTVSKNRRAKRSVSFYIRVVFLVLMIAFLFLLFSPKRTEAFPDREIAREKFYTCIYVDGGDTLWDIASEYSTAEYSDYYEYINEVMTINNLKSSYIKSGSKLCIPYYAAQPIRLN